MTLPTLAEVRAYVRVPVTAVSDEDLTRMYGAVLEVQTRKCRTPVVPTNWPEPPDPVPWPDPLSQALLRGVQRQIAARNLPLGVLGGDAGEFGPSRIPYLDSVIEKLEGPYRVVVFG